MKHYYSIKKQEIGWAHFQSNPRCQILNELSTITSLERFGHPLAYSCGVYVPRRSKDHWNSVWSQLVWKVKRHNMRALTLCGATVALLIEHELQHLKPYVITYVPDAPAQMLFSEDEECGTAHLASAILVNMRDKEDVSMQQLLTMVKPKDKKQHHCRTARQRRLNVTGCFAVKNPSIVSGRTVIVVDDVITSGATFSECAKVLRLAGAAEVYGIFLAKTSGW